MREPQYILKNFKGIIDSTLREGLQFRKANFTLQEKIQIFEYLVAIGVDYVEVSNPANREIQKKIKALVRNRKTATPKILSHIRNHAKDLNMAEECGVDGVNILCTADSERISSMGMEKSEYLERLEENILHAKESGLEVRVGVEDFFSQPFSRILEIYNLVERLDVDRIGLADTLGRAMNWEVFRLVRALRGRYSLDLEIHLHNDLGHAVSNAITAVQAGANLVDTSLLGIGERTGITPLSSLLVNLYMLNPELVRRYNFKYLTEAETYVSKICNVEMPLNLVTNPVNGFAHKAGIHLDALMKFGPQKYESFSPALIGNKRHLIVRSLVSGKTTEQDVREFEKKYQ